MGEEVAAQRRHDPLAERHHEVVARSRSDREHGHDADQGGEIRVDELRMFAGEAEVDHFAHRHRHHQRGRGGDQQRDQRCSDAAPINQRVGQ